MIEEAALFGVQRFNRSHVFGAEFNIEHVEILHNAFLAHRLGNGHDAALGQPAQNDFLHSRCIAIVQIFLKMIAE